MFSVFFTDRGVDLHRDNKRMAPKTKTTATRGAKASAEKSTTAAATVTTETKTTSGKGGTKQKAGLVTAKTSRASEPVAVEEKGTEKVTVAAPPAVKAKEKERVRSTRILRQQLEFMEAKTKTKKKKPKTPLSKILEKKVRRKDLEQSNVLFNLSVLKATNPSLHLDRIKI